jgi:lysyl-tRNA synthetase, class I
MAEEQHSKYWLDQVAEAAVKAHPKGDIIVASGHSPSGSYHVGHLREFLTASAVAWAINQRGRKAIHTDFVDDLDAFRKVPVNVDESFSKYLGTPLYLVPDPEGSCHDSYADHFYGELTEMLGRAGIKVEVVRAHQVYQAGKFTACIEAALDKLNNVKDIITEVGGRQLDEAWVPVQLLSDNNRLNEWTYTGWDKSKQVIFWRDKSGKEGELDYTKGRVKLDWRLDWPARWSIWGVAVEPFGRDHASSGSSYDTGKHLVSDIFGGEPPFPVPYDFINMLGQTKKMSASKGTGLTPGQALDVMPAEILRYFVLRSRPEKLLVFDPGLGLYNLVDEFAKVEAGDLPEFEEAYGAAVAGEKKQTITSVPFSHLVAVYQAAQGNVEGTKHLLERTGYEKVVKEDFDVLKREFEFVKNWLAKYAPDKVKFEVQKSLPEAALSEEQRKFLSILAELVEAHTEIEGGAMHQMIYEAKEAAVLNPSQAFQAIYRIILGKDFGPKAGWFLASLDRDWLIKRLKLQA